MEQYGNYIFVKIKRSFAIRTINFYKVLLFVFYDWNNKKYVECSNILDLDILYEACKKAVQIQRPKNSLLYKENMNSNQIIQNVKGILLIKQYPLEADIEKCHSNRKEKNKDDNKLEIIKFKQKNNTDLHYDVVFLFNSKINCLHVLKIGFPNHFRYNIGIDNKDQLTFPDLTYGENNRCIFHCSFDDPLIKNSEIVLFPDLKGMSFMIVAIPNHKTSNNYFLYNSILGDLNFKDCPSIFHTGKACYFVTVDNEMTLSSENNDFKAIKQAIEKEHENILAFLNVLESAIDEDRMVFFFKIIEKSIKQNNNMQDDKKEKCSNFETNPNAFESRTPNYNFNDQKSNIVLFHIRKFKDSGSTSIVPLTVINKKSKLMLIQEKNFPNVSDLIKYLENFAETILDTYEKYDNWTLSFFVYSGPLFIKLTYELNNYFERKIHIDSYNLYRFVQSTHTIDTFGINLRDELKSHYDILHKVEESFIKFFKGMSFSRLLKSKDFTEILEKEKERSFNIFIEYLKNAFLKIGNENEYIKDVKKLLHESIFKYQDKLDAIIMEEMKNNNNDEIAAGLITKRDSNNRPVKKMSLNKFDHQNLDSYFSSKLDVLFDIFFTSILDKYMQN